jgi:hypothetical protein
MAHPRALLEIAEARAWLGASPADDPLVQAAIDAATELLEGPAGCNRPLRRATYTDLRLVGPWGRRLYLRAAPVDVAAVITLTVDGVAQTVWRTEADGARDTFDVWVAGDDPWDTLGRANHLYRQVGWRSAGDPWNVRLSYRGGFDPVPDDLREAALYVVQKFVRDAQKGLADVSTVTLPSGSITLLDIPMPRTARLALMRYRWLALG